MRAGGQSEELASHRARIALRHDAARGAAEGWLGGARAALLLVLRCEYANLRGGNAMLCSVIGAPRLYEGAIYSERGGLRPNTEGYVSPLALLSSAGWETRDSVFCF